jgi:uncharacterized protein YndB with AHSA1/START domain
MSDIRHWVFIKSTPEKIYAAITTQQGIGSRWSVHNNAKPETRSIYRISFGGDYYNDIKITDLVPGQRVVWDILEAIPEWLNTKVIFGISWEKLLLTCDLIIRAGKNILICLPNAAITGLFTLVI